MRIIGTNKRKLQLSIGLCLFVALVGSLFTFPGLKWYATLTKPALTPPSWVFGPVWTALYIAMGYALYLVWNRQPSGAEEQRAMLWFFVQLFLNCLWSFCFFTARLPGMAFFEIIFLWLAIGATVWTFRKVSLTGTALLVVYWMWVTFAAYLNLNLWRLNA